MTKPIIPWIGGKRRLAPIILPLFPEHTCYVELFSGAAAIAFAKPPAAATVLNDINGELINLYRVVKHHYEEFIRQFKWAFTSRKIFEWHQMTNPETLTDIQRAARFFYLQKLCFGGRVDGQSFGTSTTSGPRLSLLTLEEDLFDAWRWLCEATIECLPWAACIEKYDRAHTLFFADPPYWETEGYGVDFPLAEYEALASAARSIDGCLVITVNDHPTMREVFAGLPMQSVPITYTVGGGDNQAERAELIIGNWPGGWPAPKPLTAQVGLGF
ncbi:DNA adenine methylase [Solimonas flava]|uniref:DNA adenine methylase n=1 Tax=Solimonas flava TaxID=415849 RepID=UPI000424BBB1|nr:DNA adenine methylase [Solimonas flava]